MLKIFKKDPCQFGGDFLFYLSVLTTWNEAKFIFINVINISESGNIFFMKKVGVVV